jgi:hypothetical protein
VSLACRQAAEFRQGERHPANTSRKPGQEISDMYPVLVYIFMDSHGTPYPQELMAESIQFGADGKIRIIQAGSTTELTFDRQEIEEIQVFPRLASAS